MTFSRRCPRLKRATRAAEVTWREKFGNHSHGPFRRKIPHKKTIELTKYSARYRAECRKQGVTNDVGMYKLRPRPPAPSCASR